MASIKYCLNLGKHMGTFTSKDKANKRLKQIEYFKSFDHNEAKDVIDLTDAEELSYSAVMRKLRKAASESQVLTFIKIFKKECDLAFKNKLNKPEKVALQNTIVKFNKIHKIKFKEEILKNASIAELGSPEQIGKYLSNIVRFTISKMPSEKRDSAISKLKQKFNSMDVSDISSKNMPSSAAIGSAITFVKHVLFNHDSEFIKKVLSSLISSLSDSNSANDGTIVSNERDNVYGLGEVTRSSFAPFLDIDTRYEYKDLDRQSPTREESIKSDNNTTTNSTPSSGMYDNSGIMHGIGPVESPGRVYLLMIKKAYATQMSYTVTDAEKVKAEKALICFDDALKKLDLAAAHLDIMKTPFKENPDVNEEGLMKARAALRRFRDKAIDNFNLFKISAFKCVDVMQQFSSDTQSVKLMRSFVSSIDQLEVMVNKFADIFLDIKSKDFANNAVSTIEEIQKDCQSLDDIINERIKGHIQTNILAKSWIDTVSNDIQRKVEEKKPLMLELNNETQDDLNNQIKEKTSYTG